MATSVTVNKGNSPYNVSSGGTDAYDVVVSGGSMFVLSDGVADLTTVSSGGSITFGPGSTDSSTTVSAGGSFTLSSGVTDAGDVFIGSASVSVLSGAVLYDATVSSGAFLAVNQGVVATSAIVSSGGSLGVTSGGLDSASLILGGGIAAISNGGTDSGSTIAGGTEVVFSGGFVNGDILKGGLLEIKSGGSAGLVTFSGGGTIRLDDSQHFTSPIANYGRPGSLELADIPFNSSGTSSATTISWVQSGTSGTLTVSDSGGPAAHITLVGQYSQANFVLSSGGAGDSLIFDKFSTTPNPVSGSVQKDTTTSVTGQLTTSDSISGATISYSISSAGTSSPAPHSPDYSFAIDELKLVENGGTTFDDTFASLTPPPNSDNASAYSSTGIIANNGHQDLLLGSNGIASGGTSAEFAILETDTTSTTSVGLKSGRSFTVSGVFDLAAASIEPNNVFGIELTDAGSGLTSGGTGDGHDQVRLQVERTGANALDVILVQKDATVTGASARLQSIELTPGSATQIELQLSNNGSSNNGQVNAAFSLLSGSTVLSTTNFTATGQIFLPTSGGTAESWTRPGFYAFAPQQSDAFLSGTYGTLDVTQTGAYSYGLNNSLPAVQALLAGQTLTDSFTITANDNNSRSASVPVNITIQGANPLLGVQIVGATSGGNPAALKFSQFLAFGDSNIDSGYFLNHTISTNPAVEAQHQASVAAGGGVPTSLDTSPQHNAGRFMNSELLAADYGLTALPNGVNGATNFAASGATVTVPLPGSLAPTIDSQVQTYLSLHNFKIDPNTLILLSGGGNDSKTASNMDPGSGQAYMIAHAQVMAADISALAAAGARYIIMGDSLGSSELLQAFTATLQATLAADGIQFISADTAGLVASIRTNPAAYGIVNADRPPEGPFSNSFQYSPSYGGADLDPTVNGAPLASSWSLEATQLVSAGAGQTNLFADNEHLAAAGQQLEAAYLQSLIQNAGPLPGETLTASPTLIGTTGSASSVTYQWRQEALGSTQWNPISGATASSYVVQPGDGGFRLDVEAFYTDPISAQTVSATSLETFAVAQVVSGGQTSTGITVLNEGTLVVLSGGTASGTVLSGGAQEFVYGTDVSGTVNDGAIQTVLSGGTATGNIVRSSGVEIVSSGGTSVNALISGGGTLAVLSGGLADPTTVFTGGFEIVSSGGTASGAVISSGGLAEFAAGAIANGGLAFAGIGGTLRFDTTAGGTITNAVISGFTPGDTIDLAAVAFDSNVRITQAGNVLTIAENGHTYNFNFDSLQNLAGWDFKLSSDGSIGTNIRLGAQTDDFNRDRTSDILFRNDSSGDTWFEAISNGAFVGWNQIGGSNTSYGAVRVGDFYGTGTSDALFRNTSTGDTWFEQISNGAFAGWHQIGGSDTHYTLVGVADFFGNGTDDVLFRNNSTGDTWFEAISNGAFNGWHQIGGSDTNYSVAGVGDFFGNGTDDILFRNNTTGDTWVEAISNGAFNGWHQIGGSDTNYFVVGVGDFIGNGTDDVLFRNSNTGDTWFEAISNGAFNGWHQVGGSDTSYAAIGVGDYFGSGTSDILFRNNSIGDTWVEAMSNGNFAGWHQVGGSDPTYSVKT
jgi:VCBS repeat-containing protein/autotransporter passenger strand-loop-strand repeat protein